MDWTKNYFDDFYLKYFLQPQSEEVTEKQVRLVVSFFKQGNKILDAGCGIGRHSLKLAEKGFKVVGVDSSELYINTAKKLAAEKGIDNISFIVKDLREIDFSEKFDGIISLWSSFGYFDDETNFNLLGKFYKHLNKGGRLLIDVENRDYILKYFIRETFKEKNGIFILERRRFHALTSVVTTHRYVIGENLRKDYLRHIRIYTVTELINAFKRLNFQNIKVYGDYSGEKFSENSKRIIIVGEKLD